LLKNAKKMTGNRSSLSNNNKKINSKEEMLHKYWPKHVRVDGVDRVFQEPYIAK